MDAQALDSQQQRALRGLFDLHIALLRRVRPADWQQACQRDPVLNRRTSCVARSQDIRVNDLGQAAALRWGQEEPRWW